MSLRSLCLFLGGILISFSVSSCSSNRALQKPGSQEFKAENVGYGRNISDSGDTLELRKEIAGLEKGNGLAPQSIPRFSAPSSLCGELSGLIDSNRVLEEAADSESDFWRTMPLVMNRYVRDNIHYLETRGRWYMQNWIDRSGKYIPMMRAIFEKEHIPPDLSYLSLPESGLDPRARSWARAVGLWQFVPSTGLRYGLKYNSWYDERRDPVLSTKAAASLLKNLYDDLGNWYLAIAAYNCGEFSVDWAIRRADGSRDFWKIKRFLPWETRNYVPQYIAVALIMTDPKEFGFDGDVADPPIQYDTVRVPGGVELSNIAQVTGVSFDSLIALNPMLTHLITPPGIRGGFRLKVPKGTASLFAEDYSKFSVSEKPVWMYHSVRPGETLSGIAARYGMSVHRLMALNHLSGSLIRPGARLAVVYRFAGVRRSLAGSPAPLRPGFHRVEEGETLGEIALAYGVTVRDLQIWNGLQGSFIRAGQALRIAPTEPTEEKHDNQYAEDPRTGTVYKVKEGDSLWKIAREFGVSIADLRVWNDDPSELRPGQLIVVRN